MNLLIINNIIINIDNIIDIEYIKANGINYKESKLILRDVINKDREIYGNDADIFWENLIKT